MEKKCVTALSVGEKIYLHGSLVLEHSVDDRVPVAVVIVDDNSGSMQGGRADASVRKTKAIVKACVEAGVPYQYATFGSYATQRGSCGVEGVSLRCDEGTRLIVLAEAALGATSVLLQSMPQGAPFRLLYVLNTDGEAHDGVAAGTTFVEGYNELRTRYPRMLEARTFVLGIGANHDQKVLGAMSVGEASYFNYPDSDLLRMVIDTEQAILPELTGNRLVVPLFLNASGEVNVRGFPRELPRGGHVLDVDLCGVQASADDRTLRTSAGEEYEICLQSVEPNDERYFDLCLRGIQDDAIVLAKRIKETAQTHAGSSSKYEELSSACDSLNRRLLALRDPEVQVHDTLANAILNCRGSQPSESSNLAARRSKIYDTVRTRMKLLRGLVRDRKAAVRAVVTLCESGVQAVRLGSGLSRDVERDYMEVLGSGGFQHWTAKKKDRVTNRALGQVNADSIQEVDAKITGILGSQTGSKSAHTVGEDEDEGVGQSSYDHPSRRRCWLTLMEDEDLTEMGDVLCLVGYIENGDRNLPLCSVSSAKVLHNAILNSRVRVCPQPMSFLTVRELLIEGKEISRGPHGHPLNTCMCMLPSSSLVLSARLAVAYAPLAASQLLTSRWIYTEVKDLFDKFYLILTVYLRQGTGEYRNGVLASLMSLVTDGVSSWQCETLAVAIEGFCRTHAETTFVQEVLTRAANFTHGGSTGGEVATPLLAVADQMVMLSCFRRPDMMGRNEKLARSSDISCYAGVNFWRTLLLRLLRDRVDRMFSAYCTPGDPDGDTKRRQKELDAESFVEVLTQGLNADAQSMYESSLCSVPDISSLETFFNSVGCLCLSDGHVKAGVSVSKSKGGDDPVDADGIDLDMDMMGFMSMDIEDLELDEFQEEAPLEELSQGTPTAAPNATAPAPHASSVEPVQSPQPLSTMEDLLQWTLDQQRTLPRRGSPSTLLSTEQALASASDPVRRLCVLRLFASLRRELRFVLNASVHMMHQVSEGAETGDDINEHSLFRLLGIEANEQGLRWLVGQVIIAIKLRANGVFRNDRESGGLTRMEADDVIVFLNKSLSHKQESVWRGEEDKRIARLKANVRAKFLSHPLLLAPCPLRIRDEGHLEQINQWMQVNRKFSVVRAKTPVGEVYTGMAKNTFLTPRSPYFMEPVCPYVAIADIFGVAAEREQSLFCPHLHTFSRGCFDELQAVQGGFEQFHSRVYSLFGAKCDLPMSVCLWVSMTLDTHFRDIPKAKALLCSQLSSIQDTSLVNRVVESEIQWHSDPATFLDRYFRERASVQPALTLDDVVLSLSNELTLEERARVAEVHADLTAEIEEKLQKWTTMEAA